MKISDSTKLTLKELLYTFSYMALADLLLYVVLYEIMGAVTLFVIVLMSSILVYAFIAYYDIKNCIKEK